MRIHAAARVLVALLALTLSAAMAFGQQPVKGPTHENEPGFCPPSKQDLKDADDLDAQADSLLQQSTSAGLNGNKAEAESLLRRSLAFRQGANYLRSWKPCPHPPPQTAGTTPGGGKQKGSGPTPPQPPQPPPPPKAGHEGEEGYCPPSADDLKEAERLEQQADDDRERSGMVALQDAAMAKALMDRAAYYEKKAAELRAWKPCIVEIKGDSSMRSVAPSLLPEGAVYATAAVDSDGSVEVQEPGYAIMAQAEVLTAKRVDPGERLPASTLRALAFDDGHGLIFDGARRDDPVTASCGHDSVLSADHPLPLYNDSVTSYVGSDRPFSSAAIAGDGVNHMASHTDAIVRNARGEKVGEFSTFTGVKGKDLAVRTLDENGATLREAPVHGGALDGTPLVTFDRPTYKQGEKGSLLIGNQLGFRRFVEATRFGGARGLESERIRLVNVADVRGVPPDVAYGTSRVDFVAGRAGEAHVAVVMPRSVPPQRSSDSQNEPIRQQAAARYEGWVNEVSRLRTGWSDRIPGAAEPQGENKPMTAADARHVVAYYFREENKLHVYNRQALANGLKRGKYKLRWSPGARQATLTIPQIQSEANGRGEMRMVHVTVDVVYGDSPVGEDVQPKVGDVAFVENRKLYTRNESKGDCEAWETPKEGAKANRQVGRSYTYLMDDGDQSGEESWQEINRSYRYAVKDCSRGYVGYISNGWWWVLSFQAWPNP